jgi:trehalose 6-phosphate phosphatase
VSLLPPALLALAQRPLLVILDYDGTLAPIVARPEDAWPEPGAQAALLRLAAHPRHRAAIVTGRRTAQVHALLNVAQPPLAGLPVVGLHGMEWPGEALTPPDADALSLITARLPTAPGLRLEDKGWTLAVHYRAVPAADQPGVEAALAALPLPPGWERMAGKKVREFRPAGFGKGRAVERLARAFPAHLPAFLGDDLTDEEGFEVLRARGGVTVKVGPGATVAEYRLDSPSEVVALLRHWAQAEG